MIIYLEYAYRMNVSPSCCYCQITKIKKKLACHIINFIGKRGLYCLNFDYESDSLNVRGYLKPVFLPSVR